MYVCKGFVAEGEICMQKGGCNNNFYQNGCRHKVVSSMVTSLFLLLQRVEISPSFAR